MTAVACPAPDLSAVLDGTDDRLALYVFRKFGFRRRNPDRDDALQVARFALVKAAREWRADCGAGFVHFAITVIRRDLITLGERRDRHGFRRAPADSLPRPEPNGARRAAAFDRLAGRDGDPADHAEAADLWAQLACLSPREREAVRLRYRDGHTLAEAGDALGVSFQRAQQITDSALIKLRRRLFPQA